MNYFRDEQLMLSDFAAKEKHHITTHVLSTVDYNDASYPIYGFIIGSKVPDRFTFCLVGGVHGLEHIGTHVVLSFLDRISKELSWNSLWEELLKKIRIVVVPAVNPVGLMNNSRSNGNGVDLMRNAPFDADGSVLPLIGGHRLGSFLPWYRGKNFSNHRSGMEVESRSLVEFFEKEVIPAPGSIILDVHSGFGFKDRLWYPFAGIKDKFPYEKHIRTIGEILNETIPHHLYTLEPQEKVYRTHGDLWDYIFMQHRKYREKYDTKAIMLPLTLEIGSWIWLKKNPWQIFNKKGLYNPLQEHRYNRTMRRHFLLFDFLLRVAANPQLWKCP